MKEVKSRPEKHDGKCERCEKKDECALRTAIVRKDKEKKNDP